MVQPHATNPKPTTKTWERNYQMSIGNKLHAFGVKQIILTPESMPDTSQEVRVTEALPVI